MPAVSERQHRAMEAAAHGHSTLGIPRSVGREYVGKDMQQSDWRGLFGSLFKFFSEEAREAEHAADAAMAAAGVMFLTPEGKVLFLKRAGDGDHKDEWCLPGGGVEEGETFEDAARREANEELGERPLADLRPIDRRVSDEDVDFATYAHPAEEEFKPKLNDEHSEYKWASPSDPPQPLHPGVAATLEALAEEEEDENEEAEDAVAHDPKNGQFTSGPVPGKAGSPERLKHHEDARTFHEIAYHKSSPPSQHHANAEQAHNSALMSHRAVAKGSKDHAVAEAESERARKASTIALNPEKHGRDGDWQRFGHVDLSKGGLQPLTSKSGQLKHAPSSYGEDEALGIAFDRNTTERRVSKDGHLHVGSAHISKATVNPYYGHEIPDYEKLGLDKDKKYRLLRDPEELARAAPSFNNLPILSEHVPLTADTHQPDLVIGSTGTDAEFDSPYLDNSLVIWPREAIEEIEDEVKRELSCCYHYRADMTPGIFEGQPYDGVMRDIKGNHVALVKEGRAGPDVMVADSVDGMRQEQENMKTRSRKADVAMGALMTYMRPRLAADKKIEDYGALLAGVTAKNFVAQIPTIESRTRAAARGKLAEDADLDDLADLLGGLGQEKIEDQPMEANGSIPARVEEGGTDSPMMLSRIKELLAHEGVAPEILAKLDAVAGDEEAESEEDRMRRMQRATDARKALGRDETPEEEEAREKKQAAEDAKGRLGRDESEAEMAEREAKDKKARDARRAADAKKARDGAGSDVDGGTKGAMDKTAVDAAIAAVRAEVRAENKREIKLATDRVIQTQRDIRDAERFVKPWVNELATDEAESAEDVYKLALDALSVDPEDAHPSAFKAILKAQPKLGDKPRGARPAQDAVAAGEGFAKRHPTANRIEVM